MRTTNRRTLVALLLFFMPAFVQAIAQGPPPCEQDPRYRSLDFWLGEWQVVDESGRAVGTNRIRKLQKGCLIEESWISAGGGGGQSMNYYDPAAGAWRQDWVDQGGGVVHYQGDVDNGVLRYEGQHIKVDGTVTLARAILEPVDAGRLRHLIEHSRDGGKTWSTYFDGTYIPVSGQAIADSAGREEAPGKTAVAAKATKVADVQAAEPVEEMVAAPDPPQDEAPAGGVKAVTRELEQEEIPADQVPEVVMASPMVLEVTPGNIYAYPENTAWRSEETKRFICDQVAIKQVGVGQKSKGDAVDLIVTAKLHSKRRQKKVDLLLELLQDDEVVASRDLRKIRLGAAIPAHGTDGLMVTTEMEMTSEQFETLFGGDTRPTLRLTLTVP